jgi:hypothetical protein
VIPPLASVTQSCKYKYEDELVMHVEFDSPEVFSVDDVIEYGNVFNEQYSQQYLSRNPLTFLDKQPYKPKERKGKTPIIKDYYGRNNEISTRYIFGLEFSDGDRRWFYGDIFCDDRRVSGDPTGSKIIGYCDMTVKTRRNGAMLNFDLNDNEIYIHSEDRKVNMKGVIDSSSYIYGYYDINSHAGVVKGKWWADPDDGMK